jgi:serine protease Do
MGAGIQDVTPALARAFKLPNASGAAITHVEPGSPAARGGLQAGDVVTAVNGEDVIDSPALRLRISRTAPGTPVKLTVQRAEGQREVTVNLGTLPDDNEERGGVQGGPQGGGSNSPLQGVSVDELDPQTSQQLRIPNEVRGVIVTNVAVESAAYGAGLRRGDVIQSVNRRPVTSVREFEAAVRGGASAVLLVNRGGAARYIVVEPAADNR